MGKKIGCDSPAVIANLQNGFSPGELQCHFDAPALAGELDRIRKHVRDHLLKPQRIADGIELGLSRCSDRMSIRIDRAAVAPGAPTEIRGAQAWAKGALAFSRATRFTQPALVNGAVGLVLAPRARLLRALSFTITRGKIVQVDVIADPARLRQLDLAVLKD